MPICLTWTCAVWGCFALTSQDWATAFAHMIRSIGCTLPLGSFQFIFYKYCDVPMVHAVGH